jgi:hypothetical protein
MMHQHEVGHVAMHVVQAAMLFARLLLMFTILSLLCCHAHSSHISAGEMRDARDARQGLFARLSARMGFSGGGAHSGAGSNYTAGKSDSNFSTASSSGLSGGSGVLSHGQMPLGKAAAAGNHRCTASCP